MPVTYAMTVDLGQDGRIFGIDPIQFLIGRAAYIGGSIENITGQFVTGETFFRPSTSRVNVKWLVIIS